MPAIGRSALWVLTFLHHLAVPCKYEGISTCIQWLSSYGQDFDEITVCFLRQGDLCLELPTTGEHGRRHFGSKRVLRRKFLEHGLSRYPNSTSTFQLSRLSISCDVNPNPGPQLNVIALLVLGLLLVIIAHWIAICVAVSFISSAVRLHLRNSSKCREANKNRGHAPHVLKDNFKTTTSLI